MKNAPKLIRKKTPAKEISDLVKPHEAYFPVVAIGASAGGLEAITELLRNLPADTGMAFIYVQHLSPNHKSLLTAILSKSTKMKVQEIDDMDKIKPDNVFVIPYNKAIEVTDGHIKVIPRTKASLPITIDILFSSLAHAQKERVIGIVLSGNANDGTSGMKEIKCNGGLTFAQDDSAKFSGMPHSAIESGAVDFILSPKEIALELARLSTHPMISASRKKPGSADLIDEKDPDLKTILTLLLQYTGSDFSVYKMNTVKRRIVRRMLLYKINSLKEYAKLLKGKTEEIDILYQDLLINVTSFFRESETYKYLKTTLLPKLLKEAKECLRIWVPACSTGEEAFSIGMMLLEIQDKHAAKMPIQIFATDLSQQAITKARAGLYTKKDLESISPVRVQRFFTRSDGGYRISKTVRELCVFAPHNILSDPPFSKLDFISCCNLFIYFDTPAQKKAVRIFHYALNNAGYLMVGKSEAISSSGQLFDEFNKKFKIYIKKEKPDNRSLPELSNNFSRKNSLLQKPESRISISAPQKKSSFISAISLETEIDNILVSQYTPASVVINYAMEIQQFRGSTELFLTHAAGKATFNILKMARPEIAFELRNAISKAIKTNEKVSKSGLQIKSDPASLLTVGIEVAPLDVKHDEPLLLVLFIQPVRVDITTRNNKVSNSTAASNERQIKKLQEELEAVKTEALLFSREQEEFAQQLQSANEEVVSSNEELQTLNEELETSKEEIESANEELTITNQELQTRNDLLDESYQFSEALTATIHEPMLVLDKNLYIKSANRSFYKEFELNEEHTLGKQLYDLANKQWNIVELRKLLEDIIPKNSHFHDYEITYNMSGIEKKVLMLNASRIIQKTNREQLILLAIHDVSELRAKTLQLRMKEKEVYAKDLIERKAEKVRLENAVAERTAELYTTNQSLEGKILELKKMNKELESFTYISSHDMQEPLRKIQTFAGRILENEPDNLSAKGMDHLNVIRNSAQRMQLLIQDLLAFSRISKSDRKFEKSDLGMVVNEVVVELQSDIDEKQATIEVGNMCSMNIIPFQFRQLFQNLINNSLKFSNPEVPPHIVIESKHIKQKKGKEEILPMYKSYCHITYTDNGIGFEKKFSEKIFEVFQRLHAKDSYKGTGIGLAIVKKIVENHQGIITASGELMKGARFDIYIPIVDKSTDVK